MRIYTSKNVFFVPSKKEVLESLFLAGPSASGTYKITNNGIMLHDLQGNLFAFIVNKKGHRTIVSAHTVNSKPRFMFSTCSIDEKKLGIEGMGLSERDQLVASIYSGI